VNIEEGNLCNTGAKWIMLDDKAIVDAKYVPEFKRLDRIERRTLRNKSCLIRGACTCTVLSYVATLLSVVVQS